MVPEVGLLQKQMLWITGRQNLFQQRNLHKQVSFEPWTINTVIPESCTYDSTLVADHDWHRYMACAPFAHCLEHSLLLDLVANNVVWFLSAVLITAALYDASNWCPKNGLKNVLMKSRFKMVLKHQYSSPHHDTVPDSIAFGFDLSGMN